MHENRDQLVERDGVKREEAVGDKVDVGLPGKDFSVSRRCLGGGGFVVLVRERFGVVVVRTR